MYCTYCVFIIVLLYYYYLIQPWSIVDVVVHCTSKQTNNSIRTIHEAIVICLLGVSLSPKESIFLAGIGSLIHSRVYKYREMPCVLCIIHVYLLFCIIVYVLSGIIHML